MALFTAKHELFPFHITLLNYIESHSLRMPGLSDVHYRTIVVLKFGYTWCDSIVAVKATPLSHHDHSLPEASDL